MDTQSINKQLSKSTFLNPEQLHTSFTSFLEVFNPVNILRNDYRFI